MKLRCTLCACCLAAVALPHSVAAQNYTFTNIADSTGPFSGFFSGPKLNNGGAVSFTTFFGPGGAGGVYRSDGGIITTLANETGPAFGFLNSDINDAGSVAYYASSSPVGPGIFRSDGQSVSAIVYQSLLPFSFDGGLKLIGEVPSVNNAGTVAFSARWTFGSAPVDAVYVGNGGSLTLVSNLSLHRAPEFLQVNNLGTVAFTYQLSTGSSKGILLGNGGTICPVIDNAGPFSSFGSLGLNDNNVVAAAAIHDSGGASVLQIAGATVSVVAGPYNNLRDVGINNANEVAFLAEIAPSNFGILTGPNPVADKVIRDGDALFGSTVTILKSGDNSPTIDGPNDAGQIVFRYSLANGRSGIALATPIPQLAGDYNANGTVDAADYALWRKNNNTAVTLPNDATPGTSPADYTVWRSHFGQPPGSGSAASANAAVPEPATLLLLMFGAAGGYLQRRRAT